MSDKFLLKTSWSDVNTLNSQVYLDGKVKVYFAPIGSTGLNNKVSFDLPWFSSATLIRYGNCKGFDTDIAVNLMNTGFGRYSGISEITTSKQRILYGSQNIDNSPSRPSVTWNAVFAYADSFTVKAELIPWNTTETLNGVITLKLYITDGTNLVILKEYNIGGVSISSAGEVRFPASNPNGGALAYRIGAGDKVNEILLVHESATSLYSLTPEELVEGWK